MGPLNDSTIRWGVWGAGRIARDVCRDLAAVPGSHLQAVAARRVAQAQALADAAGATVVHPGLAELLADDQVDVVYVATPNHCHLDDVLASLAAGKHVLCEKPLAINQAQARLIAETARRHQRFCMEAMWTRFIPAIQEAKAWVQAGRLGRIKTIEGSFGYRVAWDASSRLASPAMGGGALLDRGVYLLSLAQYLLGRPHSIQGAWIRAATGVDEQSHCLLTYGDGAIAHLAASLSTELSNQFVIAGELGRLTLRAPFYKADQLEFQAISTFDIGADLVAHGLKSRLKQHPQLQRWSRRLMPWRQAVSALKAQRYPYPGGGYQFQLAEVAQCLRNGLTESAVMSLDDSIEIARQMDELRRQWGMSLPQDH